MAVSMALWGFVLWCASHAWRESWPWLKAWVASAGAKKEERLWIEFVHRATEYEQRLKSGWALQVGLPGSGAFAVAWHEQLVRLRDRGGKLLPFLERSRECATLMADGWRDVRVKLAPAQAQATMLGGMVPVAWVGLGVLLPELESGIWMWRLMGLIACAWSGAGFWFLSRAALRSARGGVAPNTDISSSLLWPETLLGELACGSPPDLAWQRALRWSGLALGQEARFWTEGGLPAELGALEEGRRICWFSLMEGKPCFDRIERLGMDLKKEHFARVRREIEVLQTRALGPLFLFFAPALLSLLVGALWIAWRGGLSGT